MAQLPTDAVKAAAVKVVTAGVTRVVTTLVDPAAAARHAAGGLKNLPKTAVRLPLRVALGGLVLVEKARTALPGRGGVAAPDAPPPDAPPPGTSLAVEEASRSDAEGYLQAQEDTDLLSSASEQSLDIEVDALLTGGDGGGGTAAASAPVADAPPAGAEVTPIHAGRDGHREVALPPAAEAAVEAAPDGAQLASAQLPLQGYDGLSLPQIRSRLARLDVVALTQLRDYERAHADRAPVVTMLENRLTKVVAGTGMSRPSAGPVTPVTDRGDAVVEVGGQPARDPRS